MTSGSDRSDSHKHRGGPGGRLAVGLVGAATIAGTAAVVLPAPASAKGPSGPPIVVATEAPIGTPFGNLPQIFSGLKAAALAINKSGGIGGRPVMVATCNGQVNPNTEVQCAQSAVKAGAIAFVGDFVAFNPSGVENALSGASTADLAAIADTSPQFSGSNVFPLSFSVGEGTVCTTPAFSKLLGSPSKVASVAVTVPGGVNQAAIVQTAASKQGSKVKGVGTVSVGFTTVDFSPIVAQTAALGTNVAFAELTPTQIAPFITASQSAGKTWATCDNDGSLSGTQLVQLGSAAKKVYIGANLPPLSSAKQYPILKTFMSQMKAEQATGDSTASLTTTGYNSVGLNAWLGMQVFSQVAKSIKGTITPASFLAKLQTTKVNLGVIPPIDFSKPIGAGQYPKVFNDKQYLLQWNVSKKQPQLVQSGTVAHAFPISGLG